MKSKYKMTTDIPAGIITPDRVETRLGTLRFFDGFPDEATVQTVYDNLDFQRAVLAFLTATPVAQHHALRTGYRTFGPDNQTLLITETLMDSRTLYAAPNTETIYNMAWLDTKGGSLVLEIPPKVLGFINDFWGHYIGDVGKAGPDKGQGGKYLLLSPDYTGDVPDGYFVLRSRTYGNTFVFRSFIEHGDLRSAVENTKQYYRAYPLDRVGNPPATTFINISGKCLSTLPAFDYSFFEHVATVIQEEPLESVDPETRGLLASIGIRKDQPFAPDARMQGILAEAAAVGSATGRAFLYSNRDPEAYYYPNSNWKTYYIGGYDFTPGGVLKLDGRALYFWGGWGVSPALTVRMVGAGSQYAYTERDATGCYLDGEKTYRLHLPPKIPVKDFWSLVIYSPQTRSFLQTDQQFPSVSSQKADLAVNPDTSVDVYFGPEPPVGNEANWVQTIPGKGWWIILRLYGPLEPWFDKSWRPGEIEMVD